MAKQKETICWSCINSVPCSADGVGCSWFIKFEPVDGWYATRYDYKIDGLTDGTERIVDSYMVHKCPKFVRQIRPYDSILFDSIESGSLEVDDDEFNERLIEVLQKATLTKEELLELKRADNNEENLTEQERLIAEKEKRHQYYLRNKDNIIAANRRYIANNPDKIRELSRNQWARKKAKMLEAK